MWLVALMSALLRLMHRSSCVAGTAQLKSFGVNIAAALGLLIAGVEG